MMIIKNNEVHLTWRMSRMKKKIFLFIIYSRRKILYDYSYCICIESLYFLNFIGTYVAHVVTEEERRRGAHNTHEKLSKCYKKLECVCVRARHHIDDSSKIVDVEANDLFDVHRNAISRQTAMLIGTGHTKNQTTK